MKRKPVTALQAARTQLQASLREVGRRLAAANHGLEQDLDTLARLAKHPGRGAGMATYRILRKHGMHSAAARAAVLLAAPKSMAPQRLHLSDRTPSELLKAAHHTNILLRRSSLAARVLLAWAVNGHNLDQAYEDVADAEHPSHPQALRGGRRHRTASGIRSAFKRWQKMATPVEQRRLQYRLGLTSLPSDRQREDT
jgi:hypothetical protein